MKKKLVLLLLAVALLAAVSYTVLNVNEGLFTNLAEDIPITVPGLNPSPSGDDAILIPPYEPDPDTTHEDLCKAI